MNPDRCDILVVGAGPAGSSAALAAAELGAHVVIAERRSDIGVPVRCAEYIPVQLLGELDMGKDFIVQSISGMITRLPGGESHIYKVPGFVINREVFDRALGKKAVKAGAVLRLSTMAVNYIDGRVQLKDEKGRYSSTAPRVIIGADGPFSRVGKWMNVKNRNAIPAIQARLPLAAPWTHTEVYFDERFYGGYGWLFPRGREANVGLGRKKDGPCNLSLGELLDQLIRRLARENKVVPHILKKTGGWIPAEDVRPVTRGQMMLAGDAAGQIHPITGGGIAPAVICGKMAGKWAGRAVRENDMDLLTEYDREWMDMLGRTNRRAYARRMLLEENWDDMAQVIRKCWIAFREYHDDI